MAGSSEEAPDPGNVPPFFASVSSLLGRTRLRRLLVLAGAAVFFWLFLFRRSSQVDLIVLPDGTDDRSPPSWQPHAATLAQQTNPQVCMEFPKVAGITVDATTRLPHIPAKIWQVFLDFDSTFMNADDVFRWVTLSPSYAFTILDAAGALSLVARMAQLVRAPDFRAPILRDIQDDDTDDQSIGEKEQGTVQTIDSFPLAHADQLVTMYNRGMSRRILRADFLRYAVLALEGGVYSDADTSLVRPIAQWVPSDPAVRNRTRLIVGLEADASPPVGGTKYEVQFCQWTMAAEAGHPVFWTMVDRILRGVDAKQRSIGSSILRGAHYSDDDVLALTGPAAWTEVVYAHLNRVAGDGVPGGERITWKTLTGMREPRLYGDTLVLPINGFATGVPHSNASKVDTDDTFVRHHFMGAWKSNNG